MNGLEELNLEAALSELEKLITTRVVVGEPVHINDYTVVPLCSVGFGLGAGRGSGSNSVRTRRDHSGSGGGLGFGGGVRPIAVIVAGPEEVRIESVGMSDWVDWAKIREVILGKRQVAE